MRKKIKVFIAVLMLVCTMAACVTEIDFGIHDPGELTASDMEQLEQKALDLLQGRRAAQANLDNVFAGAYNQGKRKEDQIKDDYTAEDYEFYDLVFDSPGYFVVRQKSDRREESFLFIFEASLRVNSDREIPPLTAYCVLRVKNMKRNHAGLYADKFELAHYSLAPPSYTTIDGVPLTWDSIIWSLSGGEAESFVLPGT